MKRVFTRPHVVTQFTTAYRSFDALVKALRNGAGPVQADLRYRYGRNVRRKTVKIIEVNDMFGCVVEDRSGRQLGYLKDNQGNLEFWTS